MYDSSHSASAAAAAAGGGGGGGAAPVNGGVGGDLVVDGSGTINPAALNNVAVSYPSESSNTSPRGVKRSRTPDHRENAPADGDYDDGTDDHGRRKRGRPPKIQQRPSTADQTSSSTPSAQVQTPRMQSQPLPQTVTAAGSPPQSSPPEKSTPTKTTLIKALPTVRDHTTDQLNEQGDEYIPKEFDESGEKKVDAMGYPQGGREYKCRTFRVALRGSKLFMLATECARVLGYRDSYLLFNKNRSLHKIIATQIEKDDLIQQDVLPYSYRSRQIAIVSAKSMFRQFGSRVVVNGRRVRDDYWESKARKQGFTEDDLAGEKRPGAARARDAAAAEAATAASLLPALAHGDVIYSNALEGMPQVPVEAPSAVSLAPLPVLHMATADDPRLREYNSMPRARQEVTGQAYQDRTQPSSAADILNQASHTADFNKILTSQRGYRQKGLEDFYAKQREAQSESQQGQIDSNHASTSQSLESTQIPAGGMVNPTAPQSIMSHQGPMMGGQSGFHPPSHPQAAITQSPATRAMPPGIRPDMMHHRPSHHHPAALPSQAPPYGYPPQPQQMWGQPPPQPQPSPLSSTPVAGMPQYASHIHGPPQQTPSPLPHAVQQPHPSQSPRNQPRPSVPSMSQPFPVHHPQAAQQAPMASMGFPGAGPSPYPAMASRAMYPSTQGPGGQPFMAGTPQPGLALGMNAGGGVPGGVPGWPATPSGTLPSGPAPPGQSGSPLGWSGY